MSKTFTFIDLFAGIGGMRIAFQKLNGQCVFSSEWDDQAKTTYSTNFGEVPYGDITKIDEDEIPKHNILVAGFPCQAFSIAGFKSGFAVYFCRKQTLLRVSPTFSYSFPAFFSSNFQFEVSIFSTRTVNCSVCLLLLPVAASHAPQNDFCAISRRGRYGSF